MKTTITGRNIELTAGLKSAGEDALSKLARYFREDTLAHVTMSVDKAGQRVELTIPVKGGIVRCEKTTDDMYVSIDAASEGIEDQLTKYRHKLVDRAHKGAVLNAAFEEGFDEDEEEEIKIVRTKKFDLKPMYAEDACAQMELLGHTFFVFTNAETDAVNVVYHRKNGSYGLIEPEE